LKEKGQGTVYEKDGAWAARLRFTDELGRKCEKTFKAKTKAEANSRLKAFRKELTAGTATVTKDITLGKLLDRLMAEVFEPKLRSSTVVQYQGLITNHLTPLRDVRLSKMTADVLEEIFRDKSKGRRTREMLRRFLIMSLNHAIRLGLVRENIARRTLPVGGQPKLVNGLSLAEIKAILAAASNPTIRTAFRTQVELGLRVGELLGMHWCDIDWEARTVSIERQLQRDRRTSQLILGPLKTAKSRRVLPLSDNLMYELRPLQGTGHFVFSSEVSGPIEPRNYNRSLSIASKRAGVGHVSSHRLRHSYASWVGGHRNYQQGAWTLAVEHDHALCGSYARGYPGR
jgi:integrase